jgi:cellulose synthase/poly-beta-1,6-N-acetylglucosamine synthase-like glycosyltransferase
MSASQLENPDRYYVDNVSAIRTEPYQSLFPTIVVLLFIVLNLGYYYFLHFSWDISTIFYIWLLEIATFGFAYEFGELILVILLPELAIPRLNQLSDYPPVALLCCTCDDVDLHVLRNLNTQKYPNLHIFVLDDSQQERSRIAVDSVGLQVVRRPSRSGYKAGNLNNWLFRYGAQFPYFVVVDSDGILPSDFVETLVCYAEHPSNNQIAIFESLLHTWNVDNEFVYLQTVMSPLSHRQRLRLGNRFQSSLSVGHNNLYKASVLLEVGGFQENYLAEDHATSLEIIRKGWLCMTLPVTAYERLPANFTEHAKRSARYAFQTFQALSINVDGLPWSTRLKLLKDLQSYSMPVVAVIGMILLVIFNFQNGIALHRFASEAPRLSIRPEFLWFWGIFILLPLLLRTILVWAEKISITAYLKTLLFDSALYMATIWPIIRRLSTFVTSNRLGFNVTATEPAPSLQHIVKMGAPVFFLSWTAFLSILLNPLVSGLNLIWILPAVFAPLILYHYQKASQ